MDQTLDKENSNLQPDKFAGLFYPAEPEVLKETVL